MPLRPAVVHPVQHLRPVLRLRATGACMERKDRIGAVIFPGQQGGQLLRLQLLLEGLHILQDLLVGAVVILLHAKIDQRNGILQLLI